MPMLSRKRKGKRFNRKNLSKKKSKKIKKMRAGAGLPDLLSKESFLFRNRLIAFMGDIIHRHHLSSCSKLKEDGFKTLLGDIPLRNNWCRLKNSSPQPMLRRYFNLFLKDIPGDSRLKYSLGILT